MIARNSPIALSALTTSTSYLEFSLKFSMTPCASRKLASSAARTFRVKNVDIMSYAKPRICLLAVFAANASKKEEQSLNRMLFCPFGFRGIILSIFFEAFFLQAPPLHMFRLSVRKFVFLHAINSDYK